MPWKMYLPLAMFLQALPAGAVHISRARLSAFIQALGGSPARKPAATMLLRSFRPAGKVEVAKKGPPHAPLGTVLVAGRPAPPEVRGPM